MMNSICQNKLAHFNLNLDYEQKFYNDEVQTNLLINKIVNDFIAKFLKCSFDELQEKTFIYEYNDDLLGLIGYHILTTIQAVNSDFTFRLYGKKKRTKKFLAKKQKFCSKWRLKRKKDNVVLISGFNPIYKVINQNYNSNNFVTPKYNLLEQFTPQEIYTAQLFYHIGYIKNDKLCKKMIKEVKDFEHWNSKPSSTINDSIRDFYGFEIPKKITLAWFDSDLENNMKLMQDLEEVDHPVFHYYKEEPEILFDKTYSYLVKRTSNRPNQLFLNLNQYEIPKVLRNQYGVEVEFIGNWDKEEIDKLEIVE